MSWGRNKDGLVMGRSRWGLKASYLGGVSEIIVIVIEWKPQCRVRLWVKQWSNEGRGYRAEYFNSVWNYNVSRTVVFNLSRLTTKTWDLLSYRNPCDIRIPWCKVGKPELHVMTLLLSRQQQWAAGQTSNTGRDTMVVGNAQKSDP